MGGGNSRSNPGGCAASTHLIWRKKSTPARRKTWGRDGKKKLVNTKRTTAPERSSGRCSISRWRILKASEEKGFTEILLS